MEENGREQKKERPVCFVKSGDVAIPILEFLGGPKLKYWKTGSPFKEYAKGKFTGTLTRTETVHAREAYRLSAEKIRELEAERDKELVSSPSSEPVTVEAEEFVNPETW